MGTHTSTDKKKRITEEITSRKHKLQNMALDGDSALFGNDRAKNEYRLVLQSLEMRDGKVDVVFEVNRIGSLKYMAEMDIDVVVDGDVVEEFSLSSGYDHTFNKTYDANLGDSVEVYAYNIGDTRQDSPKMGVGAKIPLPPESKLMEMNSGISRKGNKVNGFILVLNEAIESGGTNIQAELGAKIDGQKVDSKTMTIAVSEQAEYRFESENLSAGDKNVCVYAEVV